MTAGWHTVHVRVNDGATGQPTPVRIRFVGPGGEYLAPYGRLTEFGTEAGEDVGGNVELDDKRFAYIDGTCEILLPPDPVTVEITKGPEFTPVRRQVVLGPGKLTLRLAVERWIDLRREGWYSGDTCAFFLSPHAALLEAAAEDVAVVNLLAGEWWNKRTKKILIPNILAFSGQGPALEVPGHLVAVNTSNHHPDLGRLGLLNCHRPVFPLRFGRPDRGDNWTLADWCDQCHRKGGLVVWQDAPPLLLREGPRGSGGEALADAILGKVDVLEIDDIVTCQYGHFAWYDLLRCGLRVPLVGGSAKDSNETALGCVRTYARLPPGAPLSYAGWIEAVRSGRTFVTNGPLLSFTVNGQDPGATVAVTADRPTVHVRAEVRSMVPFGCLEVVANGRVIAAREGSGNPPTAVLEEDLVLPGPGWIAARCYAETPDDAEVPEDFGAHTSPVYAWVPGHSPPVDPRCRSSLIKHLNYVASWVDRNGRFETEAQRQRLAGIFREALQELARRGEEPSGNGQPTQ